MANSTYFQQITSSEELYKIHGQDGTLPALDNIKTGSSWGARELAGTHVIVAAPKDVNDHKRRKRLLPSLEGFHDEAPINRLNQFIQGPAADQKHWPERELMERYGDLLGLLWFKMQNLNGDASDGIKAITRQVKKVHIKSSSETSLESISIPDRTEYESYKRKEHLTVVFSSLVTSYILRYGPENVGTRLQCRDDPFKLTRTFESERFRAIDDGGVSLLSLDHTMTWKKIHNHVAIMEAKAKITAFVGDKPVISDSCLGQMACEAILVALETLQEKIYIIHAARTHVCILEFNISPEYRANFPTPGKDDFIWVHTTQFFDLEKVEGRKWYTANICAMMRRVYTLYPPAVESLLANQAPA